MLRRRIYLSSPVSMLRYSRSEGKRAPERKRHTTLVIAIVLDLMHMIQQVDKFKALRGKGVQTA